MKYPKYGGKPFDPLRKKEFNKWRKLFEDTIEECNISSEGTGLDDKQTKTAAWNCAFHVVTARME